MDYIPTNSNLNANWAIDPKRLFHISTTISQLYLSYNIWTIVQVFCRVSITLKLSFSGIRSNYLLCYFSWFEWIVFYKEDLFQLFTLNFNLKWAGIWTPSSSPRELEDVTMCWNEKLLPIYSKLLWINRMHIFFEELYFKVHFTWENWVFVLFFVDDKSLQ